MTSYEVPVLESGKIRGTVVNLDTVPDGTSKKLLTAAERTQLTALGTLGNAAGLDVGTTAGTVAAGNDSRLSDARTPTAHAASHTAAASDPITVTQSQVTGLPATLTALAAGVTAAAPASRAITAGTGLTGGGDLSADRTLTVTYGAVTGTATQGNDARVTGALQTSGGTMTGPLTLAGVTGTPGQSAGAPYGVKPSTWSFFDSFDTGWSDYYAAGTISTDTTVTSDGGAAQKMVLPASGAQAGVLRAIAPKDFSRDHFRIRIRSTDWANVTGCDLLFMNDSGGTNAFRLPLAQYVQSRTNDEWIEVAFTRQRFVAAGAPDWASIQFLIVRAQGTAGQTPTVWFDALASYKQGPRGYVTLTCDDGWLSQYTEMFPRMAGKGWRGTTYVIPGLLGTAGYCTAAQVDEMHDRGWEIAGHGATNLSTLTQAQRLADLASTRSWLDARGYRGRDLYAYPNGACGKPVQTDVAQYFSYGRSIDFMNQPVGYLNPMRVNALTPTNATTVQYLKDAVDSAANNGEWLILGLHKFLADTTDDPIAVLNTDFQAFLDYLATVDVAVLPMGEVLTRLAAVAETQQSALPAYQRIRRQVSEAWEFLGGLTGTPFTAESAGTGAGVVAQSSFTFDAVGNVQANTGSTSAGAAGAMTTAGGILGGSGTHRLVMRAQLSAVPDGTDDYIARFGFIDAVTTTPVDGVWFEADRSASTTLWRVCTSANSVTTKTTTAVAFDANWHTFTVVLAGTAATPVANFYIDDALVGSATTNLPLNSSRAFGVGFSITKVAGTNVLSLRLDYATYQCDLTLAR